jgi:hypothetical protein
VQLAYTVAHQELETIWDALVFSSGPPITDLAFGCKEESPCDVLHPEEKGCFGPEQECLVDQAYGNPDQACDPDDLSNSLGPCQEDPLPTDPDWVTPAEEQSLVSGLRGLRRLLLRSEYIGPLRLRRTGSW